MVRIGTIAVSLFCGFIAQAYADNGAKAVLKNRTLAACNQTNQTATSPPSDGVATVWSPGMTNMTTAPAWFKNPALIKKIGVAAATVAGAGAIAGAVGGIVASQQRPGVTTTTLPTAYVVAMIEVTPMPISTSAASRTSNATSRSGSRIPQVASKLYEDTDLVSAAKEVASDGELLPAQLFEETAQPLGRATGLGRLSHSSVMSVATFFLFGVMFLSLSAICHADREDLEERPLHGPGDYLSVSAAE